MAKRKRVGIVENGVAPSSGPAKKSKTTGATEAGSQEPLATVQIVAGSYDRELHGITATIHQDEAVEFADSFLFNAHTSAIRCLALSSPSDPVPGQAQKVMLATGSTDERINVYNLSAHPQSKKLQEGATSIAPRPILENSKNRELGTLLNHSSTVTKLAFPTRSKLLSSSDDSTIAVTRTRDWSLLSNIKAPVPKPQGRPSGDTAPLGGTPSGVNDFAIHPSMKLMISVSKGEKCMRLWNLLTGKKAGVLNFGRDLLQQVGESKHSTGEGRRVMWGSTEAGDEFAVGFDRDLVVFGMDSTPRCRVMPDSRRKIHQFRYVMVDDKSEGTILAVATEDGCIMFFSTRAEDLQKPCTETKPQSLPVAKLLGSFGGKAAGVAGRIKDFSILPVAKGETKLLFIVSGSSDGKVRVWKLAPKELFVMDNKTAEQVGKLLGTYETQNRITCLEAFVMIPRPEGVEDSDDELEAALEDDSDSDDAEDDED